MNTKAWAVLGLATAILVAPMLACGGLPAAAPGAAEEFAGEPAPAAEEEWHAEEPMTRAAPLHSQATPDAMYFENYGVNPFIDTEDDTLSTFALDVDTGAYTLARRYVNDGLLPPKEAIRVEEFINFFDYQYPLPARDAVFAIHMEAAPSLFGQTQRYETLRIGIQGYDIAPEERQDVALTFVVDVSGSMNRENRLTLVKRALTMLVEELRPTDSVAIVAYGTSARPILPPTSAADKDAILSAIYQLAAEGSTNAEAGLQMGYRQALQSYNPQGINRVILLSDGVANVGQTGPGSIWETIEAQAGEGIYLTTVGVGMGNYNDVLMEQLADMGDGFYAYVDSIDEAKRLFVHDLTGSLQAIAKDAKVQVDFNPEVVARYRLIGFENRAIADESFRDDTIDAGEIGAGHSVTALYELKRHPDADGHMATVHLRWQDPETAEVMESSANFDSSMVADAHHKASPQFQLATIVCEYAEVLRESYWSQGNTLAGVLEEAERVGTLFTGNEEVEEFVALVRDASTAAAN